VLFDKKIQFSMEVAVEHWKSLLAQPVSWETDVTCYFESLAWQEWQSAQTSTHDRWYRASLDVSLPQQGQWCLSCNLVSNIALDQLRSVTVTNAAAAADDTPLFQWQTSLGAPSPDFQWQRRDRGAPNVSLTDLDAEFMRTGVQGPQSVQGQQSVQGPQGVQGQQSVQQRCDPLAMCAVADWSMVLHHHLKHQEPQYPLLPQLLPFPLANTFTITVVALAKYIPSSLFVAGFRFAGVPISIPSLQPWPAPCTWEHLHSSLTRLAQQQLVPILGQSQQEKRDAAMQQEELTEAEKMMLEQWLSWGFMDFLLDMPLPDGWIRRCLPQI